MKNAFKFSTLAVAVSLTTIACGSDSSNTSTSDTATFSFAVSDAAVDAAAEVMVCFSAVELTGNGEPQRFEVGGEASAVEENNLCLDDTGNVIPNTFGVDLLTLSGATAEALVTGAEVPAGRYGQLRLEMAAQGSYVELQDGTIEPLSVPSNELKLDGVTLTADQSFNYTLEFDLRRAVVAPPGQDGYLLKPRGLRLVDNAVIGHIEGTVSEALLMNSGCEVAPEDASVPVAALYFFEGADQPIEELTDNNTDTSAYASISVFFDGATSYPFELGYVDAGDYTVALTCDTSDDPESADDLVFEYTENLSVEADQTTTVIIGADE